VTTQVFIDTDIAEEFVEAVRGALAGKNPLPFAQAAAQIYMEAAEAAKRVLSTEAGQNAVDAALNKLLEMLDGCDSKRMFRHDEIIQQAQQAFPTQERAGEIKIDEPNEVGSWWQRG